MSCRSASVFDTDTSQERKSDLGKKRRCMLEGDDGGRRRAGKSIGSL